MESRCTGSIIMIGFLGYIAFENATQEHAKRVNTAMVDRGLPDYGLSSGGGVDEGL